MDAPLLALPTEMVFEIAKCLTRDSVLALLKTCRAIRDPLDAFLLSKYKDDIMIFAARKNDLTLLIRVLSAGADINYCGRTREDVNTALHHAAGEGHGGIITELLQYNPALEKRDSDNRTALLRAAYYGHQVAVDLLLAAGSDPNTRNNRETLLAAAIKSGLNDIASAFIHQMGPFELHEAMQHRRLDIIRLMFARGVAAFAMPSLCQVAFIGFEYLKLWVEHGANVNEFDGDGNCTPLSVAAGLRDTDMIRYLLDHGADPDAGPVDNHPVLVAVGRSSTESARLLLEHGVDLVKLRSAGVMWAACTAGSRATVELLLDAFQALEMAESVLDNVDLLYGAVCYNQVDIVKLLLERGVKVNERSGVWNETVLYSAVRAGSNEVVEALLDGGADPNIVCQDKPILRLAKERMEDRERKGLIMATLVRGGADITVLRTKARKLVNKFVRQVERDLRGEN